MISSAQSLSATTSCNLHRVRLVTVRGSKGLHAALALAWLQVAMQSCWEHLLPFTLHNSLRPCEYSPPIAIAEVQTMANPEEQ